MFERPCTLLEKEGNSENSLGQVDLRILYDDDVFGARIAAYSGNNANHCDDINFSITIPFLVSMHLCYFSLFSGDETNGIEVCNHLIAMQTTLDVTTPSEGEMIIQY